MSNNSLSGKEQRKQNREKKLQLAMHKAFDMAKKHLRVSELVSNNNYQNEFNKRWHKFDESLKSKKDFKNHIVYAKSYNHALKEIQKECNDCDLDISFPKYIVFEQRPKVFRDGQWFQDAKKTKAIYQAWMNEFENSKAINIYDVFFSLVFHNAVLQASLLECIIRKLLTKSLVIYNIYDLPVIRVEFNKEGYSTNVKSDDVKDERLTSQNIFLSPITATLIRLYNVEEDSTVSKSLKKNGLIDIMTLYQNLLHHKALNNKLPSNLKGFLKASVYVFENFKDANLPEYWLYILLGIRKTYSLPVDNWQCLIYNRPKSNDINIIEDFSTYSPNKSTLQTKKYKHLASLVSKLFKPELEKNSKKVSGKLFDHRLKECIGKLEADTAPVNEIALLTWFRHKRLTNKPSSIHTYSNNITNRWLALTYGQNIDDFDEADFEFFYAEIIALSRTPSAKNETAKLLDSFHEHLVNEYGAEPVEPMSVGAVAHVKAGYVSESMFQAILDACEKLEMNKERRDAIYVSLILGQRLGMRVGEIAKLKLSEISANMEYLDVRNNDVGSNKTSSALRSLPIKLLLKKDELRVFSSLYHRRVDEKGETLICDTGGQAFSKNKLSQIISGLIKQTTRLSYLTAHNLRHSCLSNLQLLHALYELEASNCISVKKKLMKLIPYSNEELIDIYHTLFGAKKSISNYAIAGIAGHGEPSVSFNNYIHFTDIQIGLCLWNIDYELNDKQKQHLVKLPRRKISLNHEATNDYLLNKLQIHPLPAPRGKSGSFLTHNKKTKREYGFKEVAKILHSYSQHDDFQQLLILFDVSNNQFRRWYDKINHLKTEPKYQTKFGRSRIFSSKQMNLLVPSYNLVTEDQKVMEKMELAFNKLYTLKKHKEHLIWFIQYVLQHCEYHQNHISFTKFEDFELFLLYVIKLIPSKIIHIKVRIPQTYMDKRTLNKWKNRLSNLPSSNVDYQYIDSEKQLKQVKAKLSTASAYERFRNNKPFVSFNRLLQVFCFYQCVILNDIKV
ncbi:site-specific integrase [Psychrobacter sp. FDAARGOS_221]|uniref:site-specific integrase n=1 Tax=Psychrobacter sp. FDAARGOS_221 TaxID=1975705 RepID=UPI000BB56B9B|nr:site-specific integrase [Psychrobacter sp. FDAARGOS_221]PNK61530.1 site-specific integrase [Psychrobacter sp. FDAARGOS_221]